MAWCSDSFITNEAWNIMGMSKMTALRKSCISQATTNYVLWYPIPTLPFQVGLINTSFFLYNTFSFLIAKLFIFHCDESEGWDFMVVCIFYNLINFHTEFFFSY